LNLDTNRPNISKEFSGRPGIHGLVVGVEGRVGSYFCSCHDEGARKKQRKEESKGSAKGIVV